MQACHALTNAGHELVCVSALPAKFREARERNLRHLGFPIETVYATDNTHGVRSPKADLLNTMRPLAFVDDYLPYLVGVDGDIHAALIMRGANGSPNQGEHLALAASRHGNLLEFSHWREARKGIACKCRQLCSESEHHALEIQRPLCSLGASGFALRRLRRSLRDP